MFVYVCKHYSSTHIKRKKTQYNLFLQSRSLSLPLSRTQSAVFGAAALGEIEFCILSFDSHFSLPYFLYACVCARKREKKTHTRDELIR